MANKLKDWSQEGCSTTGVGDLILSGVISINQTRFRDGFSSENVYYSISDGANREAGIGAFNGSDRITRSEVHATLVNGVFNNSNPTAISLSGQAVVSGTFNTDAYDGIINELASLDARVTSNTNSIALGSALNPTQAQKDALDASINPGTTNRYVTGNELVPFTDHIAKAAGAHAASAISNVGTDTMPTTNVQDSLEILDSRIADHLSDPIAAHEASAIRYDDSASDLQAIDVQEAIDDLSAAYVILDDDVSFRESAVSALEQGGEVTQNGSTVVSINAGSGEIIDSYSDPENQVTKDITWGQQNYDLLANAGMPVVSGLGYTEVGMDSDGNPTLAANGFTSAQRRTIVMLAVVEYFDQVITAVTFAPIVSNQSGNLLLDLIDYIDLSSRLKGMLLRPTEALGLTTWRDSGTLFSPGINYINARDDQNVAQIVAQGAPDTSMPAHVPVLFNNGTSLGVAATQALDANQYEPNGVGTLNAISNGKTVIHYMYESLGGGFFMSYAQQQYDTYDEAKAALFVDMASHKTPVEFSKGILLAQIVVQKGATSWGVSAEIFPLASSTSSGSGSGSAANAINVAYTDTYALGNNVQSALDSLAALKLTTDQYASLGAASGGTYPPTGTNAIATVDDVGVNTDILVAHIDGSNYKHDAPDIVFVPVGDLVATDVDGALVELDAEKLAVVDMVGSIGRINNPLLHMPLTSNLAMKHGNGQADFMRASEASYVDRNGLLIFVGSDVPRFEEKGLLMEGKRTNLAIQSNNFNHTDWVKHGGVVDVTSIPGTNPAGKDSVIQIKNDGGVSGSFGVYQTALDVGAQTSFSVWARASTAGMKLRLGADNVGVEVTMTTEWIRHKIEDYTASSTLFTLFATGSGDTEEYFEIAYSQAEKAPFVSSYIFNKSSLLTREDDRLQVTSQDNTTNAVSSNTFSVDVDILGQNAGADIHYLFNYNGDVDRSLKIPAGGDPELQYVSVTSMMATADLINDPHMFSQSYDGDTGSINKYLNNVSFFSDTVIPSAVSGPSVLTLMNNAFTLESKTFGHIRNLRLWDVALTASEMEMI